MEEEKSPLHSALIWLKKTELNLKAAEKLQKEAMKKCGVAFRKEREWANISLRQMAKNLDVSPAYLSDVERGNRKFPKGIKVTFK